MKEFFKRNKKPLLIAAITALTATALLIATIALCALFWPAVITGMAEFLFTLALIPAISFLVMAFASGPFAPFFLGLAALACLPLMGLEVLGSLAVTIGITSFVAQAAIGLTLFAVLPAAAMLFTAVFAISNFFGTSNATQEQEYEKKDTCATSYRAMDSLTDTLSKEPQPAPESTSIAPHAGGTSVFNTELKEEKAEKSADLTPGIVQ